MAIRVINITAQTLLNPNTIVRSVSDTLAFQEETEKRALRVYNVSFQALMAAQPSIGQAVTDELEFQSQLLFEQIIADRQIVTDQLEFTEEINQSGTVQRVSDTILFTQTARSSVINESFVDNLFLRDHVGYCFSASWEPYVLSDTIEFIDSGARAVPTEASDTITFTDTVEEYKGLIGDGNILELNQSVSVGRGINASNEITFSQSNRAFADFNRTIVDSNVVEHAMTYYFDNGCSKKEYARFVGEGQANTIEERRLVFDADFVLESISFGTEINLRNPETDDIDRVGFNRVNRETRGGELNVFSDPGWDKVNNLLFTVVALSDGKGNCPNVIGQLQTFLLDNIGREIYLHDWYGTSWRGVVVTPEAVATEDRNGWWTIAFEFQGVADEGSVPNNNMSISDQLSFNADWTRTVTDSLQLQQSANAGGDINVSVTDTILLSQTVSGDQEILILFDDLSGAGSATLDGTSPDTGENVWRSHTNIKDNGTMDSPIDAGAYYPFTVSEGTKYLLQLEDCSVVTYSDGDNCIFGFYEGISMSNVISGPTADGSLDPTTAKAVHLMREVNSTKTNGYRRGSDGDGLADTQQWTDATLRDSASNTLDLRILLDTTDDTWQATWFAKEVGSPTYTQVGQQPMLDQNVGAVGWSQDSVAVECQVQSSVTLLEVRPI